jgi:hypothetical protein
MAEKTLEPDVAVLLPALRIGSLLHNCQSASMRSAKRLSLGDCDGEYGPWWRWLQSAPVRPSKAIRTGSLLLREIHKSSLTE